MKKQILLILLIIFLSIINLGCSSTTSDGGIFKSTDQGETWAQKAFIGQQKKKTLSISNVNVEKLFFDPSNSNIIYLAGKSDGIFKTEDGGERWYQLNLTPDRIRDIAIDSQYTNNIYTVKTNNIIKSVDSGNNWEIIYTDSQGAIITGVIVDWYNQQRILATTSIGTVLLSEDEGKNWKVIYQVNEPLTKIMIDPNDSRILYILELDTNIYKTLDGGVTWNSIFNEEFYINFNGGQVVKELKMNPNDSKILYIATPIGIIKTLDGGSSWERIETLIRKGAVENSFIRNVTIMPGNNDIILFTVGRLIHKTADGGLTWKTIENFPSSRNITAMIANKADSNVIYTGTEKIEEKKKGFIK